MAIFRVGRFGEGFFGATKRSGLSCAQDDLLKKNQSYNISFEGGLGAQILSAAAYLYLQSSGCKVAANFHYFDNTAKTERKDGVTQWGWELDRFGIEMGFFLENHERAIKINDGVSKLKLACLGLRDVEIRSFFEIDVKGTNFHSQETNILERLSDQPYVCIHIRRGDYINVAEVLVPFESSVIAANRFSSILRICVVMSDTPLSNFEREEISEIFEDTIYMDDNTYSAFFGHYIMQKAAVLICSNSQYSLSAGLLSAGIVLMPKIWMSSRKNGIYNKAVHELSDYLILA